MTTKIALSQLKVEPSTAEGQSLGHSLQVGANNLVVTSVTISNFNPLSFMLSGM